MRTRTKNNQATTRLTEQQRTAINLSIVKGEGSVAFYAKKSIFDNPYLTGSQQSETWIDGFCDAEKINSNSKIKLV